MMKITNEKSKNLFLSIGVVGIGPSGLQSETTGALHAFNIPLLLVGPDQPDDNLLSEYENMLSTAPDMTAQARVRYSIINPNSYLYMGNVIYPPYQLSFR